MLVFFVPTTKSQFVRLGAVVAIVLCIGVVLVLHGPSRPSRSAMPTCAADLGAASMSDCLAKIGAWCKANEPSKDPNLCSLEVVSDTAKS